jgi:two-component system cell cycle sensor histidine kinase PleC
MHKGRFELRSRLREGTEAIATFPRARVMEVMGRVARSEKQATAQAASPHKAAAG